ncbi:MAG TPA: Smr/MutS family protein, partial [Acidobacteriota bacterium]
MHLQSGRHPLLEATLLQQNQEVVPLSFELADNKKALVVTGPNTGGKTVLLKTAGLLALMAHAALPIPAAEGSVLPRFSRVEADIGDQQSISSSLSTFSSHITNIVSILSQLEESSLILLDELGTGTDPEEGGPLAVAILQELLGHNVKAIVTSHHSQMKMFAFHRAECVTAAMEFDEDNLLPTYRMLPDQIGASHALEMAQRLGLPDSILHEARSLTGQQQRELQKFQKQLQDRIAFLEREQAELQKQKAEWLADASEKQKTVEASQKKLQQQMERLREQNFDLIRTINASVENLLAAIQDVQQKQQLRKQYREHVVAKLDELQQLTGPPEASADHLSFQPGERVWVSLYKDFGEILSIRKDQAELLIRNKRFNVPLAMLERRESLQQSMPKGVRLEIAEKHAERELNLIGQTVEEALAATDKYLDDAVLSGLQEVRLIHG